MIALAVADKPLVRDMIACNQIQVDYLETTGPLVESAVEVFSLPMLLHNSLWDWSLSHPNALVEQCALDTTLRLLRLTRAPWLSIHLGFSTALVGFDRGMQPRSELLSRREVFEHISRNIISLAEAIPVPLLIENLDYNPGGAYEYICEPTFIAEVLHQTGVGFLLDIAHARVSATRLGYSIQDYLKLLPLRHVMQIHVSGPRWQDTMLVDMHDTLLDEDYSILDSVLAQTTPLALTLEYAHNKQFLIQQLAQLHTILCTYNEKLPRLQT